MSRSLTALAPLPALFVALALLLGLEASLPMLGVGAGGRCIALAVRVPAIFALGRIGRAALGVWLSGPAEELVRLAVVLGFANSADEAYWLGLGWGLAEVPYHVLESAVLWRLQQGAPAQGQASLVDGAVAELAASPWSSWRSLERYSATAVHWGSLWRWSGALGGAGPGACPQPPERPFCGGPAGLWRRLSGGLWPSA